MLPHAENSVAALERFIPRCRVRNAGHGNRKQARRPSAGLGAWNASKTSGASQIPITPCLCHDGFERLDREASSHSVQRTESQFKPPSRPRPRRICSKRWRGRAEESIMQSCAGRVTPRIVVAPPHPFSPCVPPCLRIGDGSSLLGGLFSESQRGWVLCRFCLPSLRCGVRRTEHEEAEKGQGRERVRQGRRSRAPYSSHVKHSRQHRRFLSRE